MIVIISTYYYYYDDDFSWFTCASTKTPSLTLKFIKLTNSVTGILHIKTLSSYESKFSIYFIFLSQFAPPPLLLFPPNLTSVLAPSIIPMFNKGQPFRECQQSMEYQVEVRLSSSLCVKVGGDNLVWEVGFQMAA